MNHLEQFLGEGWELRPAGGATGEAYIAERGQQKIFVKRNSSPFLAVLSAEGIVPKLLWTKRLENGDVVTAQEWVEGRKLDRHELNSNRVARLLSKIHRSSELLEMFKRMGNTPVMPEHVIDYAKKAMAKMTSHQPQVLHALHWLVDQVPVHDETCFVVCHADVHHNNWIHYNDHDKDELYLIDWDGAKLADPVMDIAPILYLYVPEADRAEWLSQYGISQTPELDNKVRWYLTALCIENIAWYDCRGLDGERDQWLDRLNRVMNE
ncbi:phosphotransferase [Salisediminibacterium selenitireducens]|uniref:phosphotransferase n=1 Tax=Salisediminibacterium selenitireducens TaxID=85683 RepID=UPI0038CD6511